MQAVRFLWNILYFFPLLNKMLSRKRNALCRVYNNLYPAFSANTPDFLKRALLWTLLSGPPTRCNLSQTSPRCKWIPRTGEVSVLQQNWQLSAYHRRYRLWHYTFFFKSTVSPISTLSQLFSTTIY